MDNRDKELLLRVRPWVKNRDEEKLPEELPPDLVQQQRQFNARVHDELGAIPVPTGLRNQILARRKVVRVSDWRRTMPLLAIAAAAMFLAAGLFYWIRPHEDLTIKGFRSRMVKSVLHEYDMMWLTNDLAVLKQRLAEKGTPAKFTLPTRLAAVPLKGGKSLTWQGKPVSMVCFDWTSTQILYMFVLGEPLADSSPLQPQTVKKLNTITWEADGKTFLLAGELPEDRLAELVKS